MLLNRIKTLLNVEGNENLIYEIVNITEAKILNYIDDIEMPIELEFVLIELSVQRFNRIGSEGIASESIDGKSVSYDDDFTGYKHYLDDYISRNSVRKGYRLLYCVLINILN